MYLGKVKKDILSKANQSNKTRDTTLKVCFQQGVGEIK